MYARLGFSLPLSTAANMTPLQLANSNEATSHPGDCISRKVSLSVSISYVITGVHTL